ncbi:MAG: response regulator [Ignavibacteriales bacterium]|nr:response regulator [Ignavibacteriales bacterium]
MIKVLAVDDDATLIFLLRRLLQKTERVSEVRVASDGKEALDVLSEGEWAPDLIFLDINMPVMSGWDFLEEFTRSFADKMECEIVMLSSSTREMEKDQAAKHPEVSKYLSKPAFYPTILEVVTETDLRRSTGDS